MSARDVIRDFLQGSDLSCDDAINALTGAGYRILGPDELDPVTVERCADEAQSWEETARLCTIGEKDFDRNIHHKIAADMARDVSLAIRSLAPEAPQPEAKEAHHAD